MGACDSWYECEGRSSCRKLLVHVFRTVQMKCAEASKKSDEVYWQVAGRPEKGGPEVIFKVDSVLLKKTECVVILGVRAA